LTALNSTQFRNRFVPDAQGRVRDQLAPDDLIVVDEAGMSGTDELDTLSTLVEAAGAKLVYAGDHAQLGSVGAGGLLELLVGDADPIQLTEIHRLSHRWEREASLRATPTASAMVRATGFSQNTGTPASAAATMSSG
jgi:ATP-dependent exoDNAse (exonuclease V) alpha subunit